VHDAAAEVRARRAAPSSLLLDGDHPDDAAQQVSAKRLITERGDLLQIRICALGRWTQLVLDGLLGIVAFATAGTEKISWKAAQAGLRARGWEV
jgi:hypothetical protein